MDVEGGIFELELEPVTNTSDMPPNKEILNTIKDRVLAEIQPFDEDIFTSSANLNASWQIEYDGWKIELGKFTTLESAPFEIWIDKSFDKSALWYGFNFIQKKWSCDEFVTEYTKEFGQPITYKSKDLEKVAESDWIYYSIPFKKTDFGQLIFQNYYPEYFIGIYEVVPRSSQQLTLVIDRIKQLFERFYKIVKAINPPDYAKCENRHSVRLHLHRERNTSIAKKRKHLDNYTCQICTFNFSETYGTEYGTAYAEAHHIVPLSSSKEIRQTKLEDLITVCSNCHRMLHRMEGKANDYLKLKAIVARNRK